MLDARRFVLVKEAVDGHYETEHKNAQVRDISCYQPMSFHVTINDFDGLGRYIESDLRLSSFGFEEQTQGADAGGNTQNACLRCELRPSKP